MIDQHAEELAQKEKDGARRLKLKNARELMEKKQAARNAAIQAQGAYSAAALDEHWFAKYVYLSLSQLSAFSRLVPRLPLPSPFFKVPDTGLMAVTDTHHLLTTDILKSSPSIPI